MNLRITTTELSASPDHESMTALLLIAIDVGDNDWRQYSVPFVIEAHATPADCWRSFREAFAGVRQWADKMSTLVDLGYTSD